MVDVPHLLKGINRRQALQKEVSQLKADLEADEAPLLGCVEV